MGVIKSVIVGSCVAVMGMGCQPSEGEGVATLAALLEADRAFASLAESDGYIEAYYRYSADGVLLLPPGSLPRSGREEIYRADLEEGSLGRLSWEPRDGGVAASGDLGWTWGEWVFLSEDEQGSPEESRGKYLFIWEREEGSWKVAANMWNDNPAR